MVGIAIGWSFDVGLHYAVALLAMAFVLLLWGMHFSSPRSLFAVSAMAVMLFTGVLLENFQKEDLRWSSSIIPQQIAELLNMQLTVYQRYERGEREIPLWAAIKLADYYKVTLDFLVGRSEN